MDGQDHQGILLCNSFGGQALYRFREVVATVLTVGFGTCR